MDLAPLSQDREGPPPRNRRGTARSCRADLMAAAGQFSWPPAGSYLTVYGQFLVAAVSHSVPPRIHEGPDPSPSPGKTPAVTALCLLTRDVPAALQAASGVPPGSAPGCCLCPAAVPIAVRRALDETENPRSMLTVRGHPGQRRQSLLCRPAGWVRIRRRARCSRRCMRRGSAPLHRRPASSGARRGRSPGRSRTRRALREERMGAVGRCRCGPMPRPGQVERAEIARLVRSGSWTPGSGTQYSLPSVVRTWVLGLYPGGWWPRMLAGMR